MLTFMNSKVQQLIDEAEEILSKKAADIAHDLEHHRQVWTNVQKIADNIEEKVDLAALQIAAMWHDVIIKRKKLGKKRAKQRTAKYVAEKMKILGFPPATIKKTKTAILEHSVMNTQTILESRILADADLLEWFNPERFIKLLRVYTTGRAKRIKKIGFKFFAKKWAKKIQDQINFETTRKLINQKIEDFKIHPEIIKIIEKQGEKIENYLK